MCPGEPEDAYEAMTQAYMYTYIYMCMCMCTHIRMCTGEPEDAYEAMTQAFTCYEEEISDSRAQLAAVTLASATLHHTTGFGAEAYDTLATKTTQVSSK